MKKCIRKIFNILYDFILYEKLLSFKSYQSSKWIVFYISFSIYYIIWLKLKSYIKWYTIYHIININH